MKIVVIGGTGRIGSAVVDRLAGHVDTVVPASPRLGIDTVVGIGLAEALTEASVVVDVSGPPNAGTLTARAFFEASTRNLIAAGAAAGVGHYVALSIVGTPALAERDDPTTGGYFRGKLAQERLIQASSIPYTIVRATQFYEFIGTIADASTRSGVVRVPPVSFQPIAALDVAAVVARVAVAPPLDGIVELAGPLPSRLADTIRRVLGAQGDPRVVEADPGARYFGIPLGERTLMPGPAADIGRTELEDWLRQSAQVASGRRPPGTRPGG